MVIEEPKQKESFTQRKKREQREVNSPPSIFSCLTDRPCRPKLVAESPPKLNVQLKTRVAEMKPWLPVLWTPLTKGLG